MWPFGTGIGHGHTVQGHLDQRWARRPCQEVEQGWTFVDAAGAHDPDEHAGPGRGAEWVQGLLVRGIGTNG